MSDGLKLNSLLRFEVFSDIEVLIFVLLCIGRFYSVSKTIVGLETAPPLRFHQNQDSWSDDRSDMSLCFLSSTSDGLSGMNDWVDKYA